MLNNKIVTFSYDDGVTQDERLIALFDKYHVKATFNLNYALLGEKGSLVRNNTCIRHDKVKAKDVKRIYYDGIFNDSLHHFIEKYKYEKSCLDTFSSVKDFMKLYSSFLQVKTKVDDFNKYINYNLPFQVYYQSYVSRSFAWTQKAFREIGFREIQDMYASMNYIIGMGRADLAKSMLSQWIKNVYHFGYANHNFYQTGKQGGESSDDALWLIQAVYRYISLTNDIGFLNEEFDEADTTEKKKTN